MAFYNQRMNDKLFAKAAELPADELAKDCGAFFASISGTLNHIMVGDLFWLYRFVLNKHCREILAPLAEFSKSGTFSGMILCSSLVRKNLIT